MCTITINSSLIVATPLFPGTEVYISGTVNNCTSGVIKVTVDCVTGVFIGFAQISGNTWTATAKSDCPCDQPVTIQAICQDTPPCSATYSGILKCSPPGGCCPTTVKNNLQMGIWNAQGHRLVTFETKLGVPAGCSITVQRDFGDGTLGKVETFYPGDPERYETHPYSPGNYTSKLNILSPTGCGLYAKPVNIPFTVPACADPNFSWIQTTCLVLGVFFMINAVPGLAILAVWATPSCLSISPSVLTAALTMLMVGYVFLTAMYLMCKDCVCNLLLKMWGEQFLATAAVLSMFGFAGVCSGANIFSWLGTAVVAGVILWGAWYGQYKNICPLTQCDYWQAVADAYLMATFSVVIVFGMLNNPILIFGLLYALAMIFVALATAISMSNYLQSQGKC